MTKTRLSAAPSRRSFLQMSGAALAGAGLLPFLKVLPAQAQAAETVVVVTGQTINSLDIHRTGTNRASYQTLIGRLGLRK